MRFPQAIAINPLAPKKKNKKKIKKTKVWAFVSRIAAMIYFCCLSFLFLSFSSVGRGSKEFACGC